MRQLFHEGCYWSHRFDTKEVRDLFEFLHDLAERLHAHRDFFRKVVAGDGEVTLFCGIFIHSNWDEVIPHRLSWLLGMSGVDLRLDVYPADDRHPAQGPAVSLSDTANPGVEAPPGRDG